MARRAVQGIRSMKPRFRNRQPSNYTCVGYVCETPGCVEHIKCTGSISGPLIDNHNGPKEDDGHSLKSWSSGSSAIWRIIPY